MKKFYQVNSSLDAVTAGEDHDNDDEDGGDIQISSLSHWWVGEQDCLLLNCLINYEVEEQQRCEGKDTQEDRKYHRNLTQDFHCKGRVNK